MKYYATVKHHSVVGYWDRLAAKTLTGAKRIATRDYGYGYHGHIICLVETQDNFVPGVDGYLNDLPAYRRVIGDSRWQEA